MTTLPVPLPLLEAENCLMWEREFYHRLADRMRGQVVRVPDPDTKHDGDKTIDSHEELAWPELVHLPLPRDLWPDSHYDGEGIPLSASGAIGGERYRYALDLGQCTEAVLTYRRDW